MGISKWLRRKLLHWLLKDGLPELRVGENTVNIDGNSITLPGLSSNPTLAQGKLWYRSDISKLKFSPDGSNTTNILKEDDPLNIAQIAGTALTGRNWSNDFAKLDVPLTTLAKLKRWGRNIEPAWIHGGEITAPAANTALVSKTVSSGKTGYIYGFLISAGEANDFKINWTSGGAAKSIRIPFSGEGALQCVDFIALNEGLGADAGTDITITNANAGASGVIYQARLLYAEM